MQLSTRLMAAMVALVALTATSISVLTYRSIEAVALPRALSAIEFQARLLALELEVSVRADAGAEPAADLRAAFSRIRSAATQLDGHVFLANQRGDYLLHPDPAKEFNATSANPARLQDEFPDLALALTQDQPLSRSVTDRAGERFGAAVAPVQLADGARLSLIAVVPHARMLADMSAARQSILLAGVLAVLAAIALAAMLTRSLTRPLAEMIQAVATFGSDKPILVPTNATGEIGVLAKTFAQRAAEIRANTAALTREIQQRQRIFDTSLDLIVVVDRRGEFLQVSPSARTILGYRPDEMIGRSAREFLLADDLGSTRHKLRLGELGQDMHNFECRLVHSDGHAVTLAWTGVWSQPEQRHYFIGRDVTERRRAERQKAEYLATVSHELRTPLTSIAGSLSLLSGGAAGELSDQAKRLLTIAHANSRRLVRLINDILDVEKLESGNVEFTLQRVYVKPLIDQAIEAIGAFTDSFNVHVLVEDGAAEAAVRADPDRLTQVMVNLLSNAVKYSPPNAQVLVAIVVQDSRVRIAVRDHGPGIPDAFKGRMFERFAQADGASAHRLGGTGLGLSIVRQIVTRLGGDVGYEPAPGGGTIFHVDLPLWNEQAVIAPGELRASA